MSVRPFPSFRFSKTDRHDLGRWVDAFGAGRAARPLVGAYDEDCEFAALEVAVDGVAFGFVVSPSTEGWLLESPHGADLGIHRTLRVALERVAGLLTGVGGPPRPEGLMACRLI